MFAEELLALVVGALAIQLFARLLQPLHIASFLLTSCPSFGRTMKHRTDFEESRQCPSSSVDTQERLHNPPLLHTEVPCLTVLRRYPVGCSTVFLLLETFQEKSVHFHRHLV